MAINDILSNQAPMQPLTREKTRSQLPGTLKGGQDSSARRLKLIPVDNTTPHHIQSPVSVLFFYMHKQTDSKSLIKQATCSEMTTLREYVYSQK